MRLVRRKNRRKRKVILITKIIFISIAILSCLFLLMKNKKTTSFEITPELLRTQSYIDVDKEKDKAVTDIEGNKTDIEFDAFFLKDKNGDGIAEAIRGTCNKIGTQANLYMEVGMHGEGYIKDGVITINSDNFYLNTTMVKDNEIATNCISPNAKTIKLNDIVDGTQKLLIGSVRSGDYSSASLKTAAIGNNISNYSKENSVTFSGIYVNADNEEKEFSKTVPFMVDWYGEIDCNINTENAPKEVLDFNDLKTEEGIKLDFTVTTTETLNELIMAGSYISGTIPEINGYKATSVKISGSNVGYTYDKETGKFTAQKEARIDKNGKVTANAYTDTSYNSRTIIRNNKFDFSIIYPLQAFEEMDKSILSFELIIPIEAVNKGYNNPNEKDGFLNPEVSNTANGLVITVWNMEKSEGTIPKSSISVSVGKYVAAPYYRNIISKEKPINVYNGTSLEENDDTYLVTWNAYTGGEELTEGILMSEGSGKADSFKTNSNQDISMEDITTNKGIYFSGIINALGTNGWIKVYDADTNMLIKKFDSKNWNQYNQDKPFYYDKEVKHIRVETSKPNKESYFYAYNIKRLDVEYITENFSREEFDNISYVYSYLEGILKTSSDSIENMNNIDEIEYWTKISSTNSATYNAQTSIASISIKENTISTQSTAEHEIITIKTETEGYNVQKWKGGTFLVKLPDEIVYADINNITIDDSSVKILAYDIYTEEYNGKENYYIKVLTECSRETSYAITIDCNLTPDPRVARISRDVSLYAVSENAYDYYYNAEDRYDVDEDLNLTEKVIYRTTSLTMDPGSALNTTQTASNYDTKNSTVIAPRIAVADKEQRSATITLSAMNYYTYNLKDIRILGVLPFVGNDHVIRGNDLGSEFTAYMSEKGITPVNSDLKGKTTVYYSEKENHR